MVKWISDWKFGGQTCKEKGNINHSKVIWLEMCKWVGISHENTSKKNELKQWNENGIKYDAKIVTINKNGEQKLVYVYQEEKQRETYLWQKKKASFKQTTYDTYFQPRSITLFTFMFVSI